MHVFSSVLYHWKPVNIIQSPHTCRLVMFCSLFKQLALGDEPLKIMARREGGDTGAFASPPAVEICLPGPPIVKREFKNQTSLRKLKMKF